MRSGTLLAFQADGILAVGCAKHTTLSMISSASLFLTVTSGKSDGVLDPQMVLVDEHSFSM